MIDPTADLEPVTAGALRRFLNTYSVVPDLPISIAMRSFARVVLTDRTGGDGGARGLARAMIGQLATFHAPDDLVVAACVPATGGATGTGSSGCRTRCTRLPTTHSGHAASSSRHCPNWTSCSPTWWPSDPGSTRPRAGAAAIR